MNWDDLIGATKDVITDVGTAYVTKPDTPVSTGQGGAEYEEGQPAYFKTGGIKPMYLIAGGIGLVVLFGMFVAMRR